MKAWKTALVVASVCLMPAMSNATDDWPDRPIRVVVPYTPGGGTDGITRNLADKITRATQWNIVVENKPGAGGNIGMNQVAKSTPDGYVIGMGQTANLAINPAVLSNMPFDATKDFAPVALIAEVPTILVVRQDAPWQSIEEIIADAKQADGHIRQAVATLGTVGHLAGEMLANSTGVKFLVVPYKGASPAVNDLIGGQTDIMFATPQGVMSLIEAGKVRPIAVTSARRLSSLPDVPTVAESGYPGFQAVDWKALVAPAGTPAHVIKKLNEAANTALKDADLLAQLETEGSTPMGGTSGDAQAYIGAQQQSWAKLVKASNIRF